MSSWGFAPVVTNITFSASATPVQLISGLPTRVWGYIMANVGTNTTQVITIQSGDGSVTYSTHTMATQEVVIIDIKFIADKGIRVLSTGANFAETNVTFFHSNPGS